MRKKKERGGGKRREKERGVGVREGREEEKRER